MGYGKWIGGVMGFMAMGPLGALAGFAIGSLFDTAASAPDLVEENGGYSAQDGYAGQRNSFLFSLLVMASYIIRADGRIMHSEMEVCASVPAHELWRSGCSAGRADPA